eukprot:8155845-Pyramimonas_sp.AAC.1
MMRATCLACLACWLLFVMLVACRAMWHVQAHPHRCGGALRKNETDGSECIKDTLVLVVVVVHTSAVVSSIGAFAVIAVRPGNVVRGCADGQKHTSE